VRPAVAQAALYRMMASGLVEAAPRGALVDVRLRQSRLDAASRREMSARLKRRTGLAYDRLDEVGAYAELATCRREYLLRCFGDEEEVAPCGGCDVCLGEGLERTGAAPVPGSVSGTVGDDGEAHEPDPELFERLRRWRSEQSGLQKVPAYVVLHNSHIEEISTRKPRTTHELGAIKGVGLRRAARYGEEILALVRGEEPGEPAAAADAPEADSSAREAVAGEKEDRRGETSRGYRAHLRSAGSLLAAGRGSEAVPELARALELGGEEARREVDELLSGVSGGESERREREAAG